MAFVRCLLVIKRLCLPCNSTVAVQVSTVSACVNLTKTLNGFKPVILNPEFTKMCITKKSTTFPKLAPQVLFASSQDFDNFLRNEYMCDSILHILLPSSRSRSVKGSVPFGWLDSSLQHMPVLEKRLPPTVHKEKLDPRPLLPEIREPMTSHNIEQRAARLIIIRRRKMKKHKLRKLRKRMYFEWAKRRQRREARKEKAFLAEQLACIRLAEIFNCEQWVEEFLRRATTDPSTLIEKKPILPRPSRYVIR